MKTLTTGEFCLGPTSDSLQYILSSGVGRAICVRIRSSLFDYFVLTDYFLSNMNMFLHTSASVSFILIAAVYVAARSAVLELGDADFDYMAAEHETMLVKFYAPW